MAISAGVEGTFRLGDVFSKPFSVFGRHIIAFFLVAFSAISLPTWCVWPSRSWRLRAQGCSPRLTVC